jgi:hypothetical protein
MPGGFRPRCHVSKPIKKKTLLSAIASLTRDAEPASSILMIAL